MKTITIKTQAELDALPERFDEYTVIRIESAQRLIIRRAWENSSVEAWGNSSVEAWGNSSVVVRGNSSVEAWGNSSVVAWGNSSVEAWENSSVVVRENSSVEAWGNSSVEAWGNSSVEAWGQVCVRAYSDTVSVILFAFAVCYATVKAKIKKKAETATIIIPVTKEGTDGWLEANAIKPAQSVIVFKRVSKDFLTQEGKPNETKWEIGSTLTHPAWNPESGECGPGKFHACSHPYFCDEFRSERTDRYIAIGVNKADLYAYPNPEYPHKIGFRKGKVLYECDRFGKELKS